MDCYSGYKNYYGDIHNHCGITFGYGSIENAIKNARERLDFCSVTAHAQWTDIPSPNPEISLIIDFHKKGFENVQTSFLLCLWEL